MSPQRSPGDKSSSLSKRTKKTTYNTEDSLVVTDPTTNSALTSLSNGEQTGSRVPWWLWSAVLSAILPETISIHIKQSPSTLHYHFKQPKAYVELILARSMEARPTWLSVLQIGEVLGPSPELSTPAPDLRVGDFAPDTEQRSVKLGISSAEDLDKVDCTGSPTYTKMT
ncbi:hypothetical protein FZEAL_4765 [Fusarium zealandicum]|uniref:Uncharacterized protein n=1 Tax=Fusarium zealandicum TaxID=1053134 RepID=A0A8H4XLJ6_9HYPO|nr:hypothetical protein FZEAL_4765 [Fusarium zealandicum]